MKLRLALNEDKLTVLGLYEEAKKEEFCLWNEFYPTIEDIEIDLNNDNLYVLDIDNKVVGAISIIHENELDELEVFKVKEDVKELARVVIAREYQGKGLASYMVREIEKVLRRKDIKAIHLLAGKSNPPAYKTYLKEGFEILGETFMFGEDYYIMEKVL